MDYLQFQNHFLIDHWFSLKQKDGISRNLYIYVILKNIYVHIYVCKYLLYFIN